MIRTLLENNFVPQNSENQTADKLEKEFQKQQLEISEKYKALVDDKLLFENTLTEVDMSSEDADFTQNDVLTKRHEFNAKLESARENARIFNNEMLLLKKYGDNYAYLNRLKEIENCNGNGVKLQMVELPKDYEHGTTTDDSYFYDLAGGVIAENDIALMVEVDEETPPFFISVQPHDNPANGEREEQLKISIDDENLENLSKENLQKILTFCESHGFPTYSAEIPFSLDGLENEDKFKAIFSELKHQAEKLEEIKQKKSEKIDNDLAKEETYESVSLSGKEIPSEKELGEKTLSEKNQEQKSENMSSIVDESQPLIQKQEVMSNSAENPALVKPENQEFMQAENSTLIQPVGVASAADNLYENFATDGEDKGFWKRIVERIKKPFVFSHSSSGENFAAVRRDFEKKIEEKMLHNSLGKEKGMSFFKGKAKSGLFGKSWTVYTVFDTPDKKNLAENGRRDKSGKPKYTYSYKIYVNQDSNGVMHFAYHMRDNKKVSEDMVGALAGQFKDAGYTHMRFPRGVPDADKGVWRTALAEKGIVPVGMSLDRAKAQAMIEAAKKKLSDEDFARFKFNLGKQMKENYESKGGKIDRSESEYIDSLINSHYYEPFAGAYNAVLKGGLSQKLRAAGNDSKMGAVRKVAAYQAFSRLFAVYDSTTNKTTIAQSPELTEVEKRRIQAAGLDIEPYKLRREQFVELYELLVPRCMIEAKKELDEALMQAKDVGNIAARGAKRADNIIIKEVFDAARNGFEDVNERLKNNGCDEIAMPKVMGRLQYDAFYDEHPEFLRRNVNTNNPAPAQNNQNHNSNGRNP